MVRAALGLAVAAAVALIALPVVAPAHTALAAPPPTSTPPTPTTTLAVHPSVVAVSREHVVTQPEPVPPGQEPPAGAQAQAESSCGVLDVSGCISEAFTGLLRAAVTDVVNPALELLSESLLQTPPPSTVPRLAQLWSMSWQLAVACYGLLVLVGAVVVMAHQSVQTRYGLREVAPRLLVGFAAGWLSLPVADMAVQVANAVSGELVGGVDEQAGTRGLVALMRAVLNNPSTPGLGTSWVLLAAGAVIGAVLLALLCGYVLRVVLTIVLVAAAPLVLMWHALPQTDGLARWWWRALAALLAIQIVQALVLAVGLQILLPPRDNGGGPVAAGVLGLPASGVGAGWVTLLVLGVLLWVMVRVPGWVWSQVKVSGGGRSVLGGLVTTAIAIKTGGMLRGALAAGATRSASTSGPRPGPGTGVAPAQSDPYAGAPVFAGGQLGLPLSLPGRRSRGTGGGRAAPDAGRTGQDGPGQGGSGRGGLGQGGAEYAMPRPGPGQTALPLDGGGWPEHRPVAGPRGQWRLPIDAERGPRPPEPPGGFAPHTPAEPARGPGRGQQRFPETGYWPEQRPVAGPGGQYRFAFPVARARGGPPAPRQTPPPAPSQAPSPGAGRGRGRQLSFDDLAREMDPFRGNRPLARGQYPLPLPGLTRSTPPARPAPPTPRPATPRASGPGPGQTRLPIHPPPTRRPIPPRAAPSVHPRAVPPGVVPPRAVPPRSAPSRGARPPQRPPGDDPREEHPDE